MFGNVLAGIVTYEPDPGRLRQNIEAVLANRITHLVIVDNGSSNVARIEELKYPDVELAIIRNSKNLGIAKALNQIFELAVQRNIEWVLTLDQDSIILPNMMETYAGYMDEPTTVSLTCLYKDHHYQTDIKHQGETEQVIECFTSGNLVRTTAWQKVGGFNEKLFIDMVDSDFCYRLGEKGLKILRINKTCLIHELGNATEITVLGKKRQIYNHNAFRKYYMARNGMYCLRRFPRTGRVFCHRYSFIPRMLIKILFFETGKTKKAVSFMHGLFDGVVSYSEIRSGEVGNRDSIMNH